LYDECKERTKIALGDANEGRKINASKWSLLEQPNVSGLRDDVKLHFISINNDGI
jgi:hypothetical protein